MPKTKTEFVHSHKLFIRLCAFLPHIRLISPRKGRRRKAAFPISAKVEHYLLLLRANPPPCLADSSLEVHNGSTCNTHMTGADQTPTGNLKMNGSLESLKKIVANLNDAQLNPNTGDLTYLSTSYACTRPID